MTREELTRLRHLRAELTNVEERLARTRASAERTTTLLTGLPKGSAARSKIEESVAKLNELTEALLGLLDESNALKAKLIDEALSLPTIERQVLICRYVEWQSWREIGRLLDKAESYLFQVHRRALKNIIRA